MVEFRVVAFSVLLSLVLGAYQKLVPSPSGPALLTSDAWAQAAAKKEQKVTATIALPGYRWRLCTRTVIRLRRSIRLGNM